MENNGLASSILEESLREVCEALNDEIVKKRICILCKKDLAGTVCSETS